MPNVFDLFGRNGNGMGMLQLMGLGGSTVGIGNLTMLVIMVAIVIFRPNQIARLGAFRRAFFFIGGSILLSPVANLLFMLLAAQGGGMVGSQDVVMLIISLFNHLPAIMTGIAVLYLGRAIIPRFMPPAGNAPSPTPNRPPFAQDEPPSRPTPPFLQPDDSSGKLP